jgi:hypothetical protein
MLETLRVELINELPGILLRLSSEVPFITELDDYVFRMVEDMVD